MSRTSDTGTPPDAVILKPRHPHNGLSLPAVLVEVGGMPAAIVDAGDDTVRRFLQFFAAEIRNSNTRGAYARAVVRFFAWCEERQLSLLELEAMAVAVYIEEMNGEFSPSTVKQHLAAIRRLFDYLMVAGVGPRVNPAAAVRGPRLSRVEGTTPVLYEDDARAFLEAFDDDLIGLRDAAIVAVMLYSFARVSAVMGMEVKDFREMPDGAAFVLHEKGGKERIIPAHPRAAARVKQYIAAAGLTDGSASLFQSTRGQSKQLTGRALDRRNAWDMIKRRALAMGFPAVLTCHSMRASGITEFLGKGGRLEVAAQVAGHASTQTTRAYDKTKEKDWRRELVQRITI